MGQKVNPIGFRLGITRGWNSRWFSNKDFSKYVIMDFKIRDFIKKSFYSAGISRVEIERYPGEITKIIIWSSRPAIVIGKKGRDIDALKEQLQKIAMSKIDITIEEVNTPELDAQLVAENIANQLERRVPFRRAMKKVVQQSLSKGVKGIKVAVKGRLNGAEMKRKEWYIEGRLPLQTLKSNIDYGFTEAHTKYGRIGVKCWIYIGDVIIKEKKREMKLEGLEE